MLRTDYLNSLNSITYTTSSSGYMMNSYSITGSLEPDFPPPSEPILAQFTNPPEDLKKTLGSVNFSTMYQLLLEAWPTTTKAGAQTTTMKYQALHPLLDTFSELARSYIVEIDTKSLRFDETLGGIAGGTKYRKNGVFIKSGLDVEDLYRNPLGPLKANSNEFRVYKELINCDVDSVCFPLFVLNEYKGRRMLCVSELPIDSTTRVSGQETQVRDIQFEQCLIDFAEKLNLKEHLCTIYQINSRFSIDTEGHKSSDGRYYLIDPARNFPPEYPSSNGSQLYNQLRPELVKKWENRLNPDCFTQFSKTAHEDELEIKNITSHLLTNVIPKFAKNFEKEMAGTKIRFRYLLHAYGINLRHIGIVKAYVETQSANLFLLKEMILRTLKTICRTELQLKSGKLTLDQAFWTNGIKQEMKNKYEYWKNSSSSNKWNELVGVFNINIFSESEMKEDFSTYFSVEELQSFLYKTTGCLYSVNNSIWTPEKFAVITKPSPLLSFNIAPSILVSNLMANENLLEQVYATLYHNVESGGFSYLSLLNFAVVMLWKFKNSKEERLLDDAYAHIQLAKLYKDCSDVDFVMAMWKNFSEGNFHVKVPSVPEVASTLSTSDASDIEKIIYTYNNFSWNNLDAYPATKEEVTRRLHSYMYLNSDVLRRIEITENNLKMYKDEQKSQLEYSFTFSDSTSASPTSPMKSHGLPLKGIRIALDPGDIGGVLRDIEDRKELINWNGTEMDRGTFSLETMKVVKEKLASLGAEVIMTRQEAGKLVSQDSYEAWLSKYNAESPHVKFNEVYKKLFGSFVSSTPSLFDAEMLKNPTEWLKSLYYRADLNIREMQMRAKIINEFDPDITIHINFCFEKSEQTNTAYVPGGFMRDERLDELAMESYRYHFTRLLVSGTIEKSILLSKFLLTELEKSTGIPPQISPLNKSMKPTEHAGVFCRNLSLTKFIQSPICYLGGVYQHDMSEIADAIQNGVLNYFAAVPPKKRIPYSLVVCVDTQTLLVINELTGEEVTQYPVSTSKLGESNLKASNCTPTGHFSVCEVIGYGQEIGSVFKGRVKKGHVSDFVDLNEDLILTRILWLQGEEESNSNTKERFVYIHGTNQEAHLGKKASHGCVRMGNADIVELVAKYAHVGSNVKINL